MIQHSSNALRDLSPLSGVSRLHWAPFDLLRIVAERYRAFLQIHVDDDPIFMNEINPLDFSERDHLIKFYRSVMPHHIKNNYGQVEDSIAYIIRHTQLLPREFILLFSIAIKISHRMRGTWRYIQPEAIVQSIQLNEPMLSNQILKPYIPIYGELIRAAKDLMPSMKPICSLGDLDRLGGRMKRRVAAETDDPWRVLFDMGVIGYVDPSDNNRKSSYYEYGCFHFNSKSPITFANHIKYCVHPVFSGTWHMERDEGMKFVYPSRVDFFEWQ